jgi:hypothetical protein
MSLSNLRGGVPFEEARGAQEMAGFVAAPYDGADRTVTPVRYP